MPCHGAGPNIQAGAQDSHGPRGTRHVILQVVVSLHKLDCRAHFLFLLILLLLLRLLLLLLLCGGACGGGRRG